MQWRVATFEYYIHYEGVWLLLQAARFVRGS
jgi:hypothetical protein